MAVRGFLDANGRRLVQEIDLGTTARVFVVNKEGRNQVLKTPGAEVTACSLRLEWEMLRYLNGTAMSPVVPAVGAWVEEVGGFWMEYLRHPTPAQKKTLDLPQALALALRTLHALPLPATAGIADDRPSIAAAVSRRLRASFDVLNEGAASWAGLAAEDGTKLEFVRAKHEAYSAMLPALEAALDGAQGVLTHGDLSGDNLMVRQDGSLALVDWGEARITSPLTDVAWLLVHAEWNEGKTQRFLGAYFADRQALEKTRPAVELLARLVRYDACVRSLRWLNLGDEGLDAIGRAFFERQLELI